MVTSRPRLVVDAACLCGESPLWDPVARLLWWIDMSPPRLFSFNPATAAHRVWTITHPSFAACLLRSREGLVLVGTAGLGQVVVPENGGVLRAVGWRELPLVPGATFNDGKVHISGASVLASADPEEKSPLGRLEHIGVDGRRTPVGSPMVIGNGPAFSPDGMTMYASDTVGRRILAFALNDTGLPLGDARVFATVGCEDGMPDGMTTDAEGLLWVALWGGGQVVRYDPAGRVTRRVALPARNVTSCAFGGPELTTLWITTACGGLSDAERNAQPGAGGLFALEAGVAGRPEPELAAALART